MLCSTNAINPKLQNISAAAALKLQNALHVQQFQHFQEAPALGSSFTCMLEKRPRILNAHHISKADPSAVQALGLATSLAEEIWPQQPVFTWHLPSWPGNLSPYPTEHPIYELCV